MRPIVPSFPSGGFGAGLFLLRLSVAIALFGAMPVGDLPDWTQALIAVLALAVLLGFRTRLMAVMCLTVAVFLTADIAMVGVATAGTFIDAIVLALTGPGAFSVDARLHGRQTVMLPDPEAR